MSENKQLRIDTEAMGIVFNATIPLSEEARLRVVAAAFALHGENNIVAILMEARRKVLDRNKEKKAGEK